MTEPAQRLDLFSNPEFDRGASKLKELAWMLVQAWIFGSWLPGSGWRVRLLRAFGATIGQGVVIKPHVSVKFPWKLKVGDHSWIGERVWIDNLEYVKIGAHVCISQGAYLCTGSHNWTDISFPLIAKPIDLGQGSWIGAHCRISPGTILEEGAVLNMGQIAKGTIHKNTIVTTDGSPKNRQTLDLK